MVDFDTLLCANLVTRNQNHIDRHDNNIRNSITDPMHVAISSIEDTCLFNENEGCRINYVQSICMKLEISPFFFKTLFT